jgi:septum site-determining protein MinD
VYDKTAVSPADMMAICRELRSSNDYVLIDSPAGIELGFHNAIAGADDAIVVTTPEVTAVRAADRIVGLLESSGRPPGRLVVNRIRPAMVRRGDMLGAFEVIEYLAIDLLGVVPEDEAVIAAAGRGEPVARELKTLAAQSFHNIAHRLLGEDVPFMPIFDEPESVFRRLRQLLRLR